MKVIRANKRFLNAIGQVSCNISAALPPPLLDIVKDGLRIVNGCIVLEALQSRCPGLKPSDFPDKTGYECFVNHLHITEYIDADNMEIAIGFFYAIAKLAIIDKVSMPLAGIIGFDDTDVTIRFHVAREGESWLCDDLEEYQYEGIAEVCIYAPGSQEISCGLEVAYV